MRILVLISLLSFLPIVAFAQERATTAPFAAEDLPNAFQPLPLHDVAALIASRYTGRMIGASLQVPRMTERQSGVALVYAIRIITPGRDVLDIRVDARSGRFLEISGRGQIAARKPATAGSVSRPKTLTNQK